jgi:uncharacterized protein (TIGR02271 family)
MAGYENENTVFGYFPLETQAEAAVRQLHAAGFTRNQISLAGQPDNQAYTSGTSTNDTSESHMRQEGRKAGQAVGGFWDRIKSFFESEGAEPYADEPTRGDLATREITHETGVYDYDPDQFEQSWGTTMDHSRYFGQRYGRAGEGIIVMVKAAGRREEAETILEANGADLGASNTRQATSYPETGDAAYADRSSSTTNVQSPRRIQLYGEVLRVHRDRVERGEVRLRKETVTETQNIQVPVTREELVVERVPVTGEQAAPGATVGSDSEEIRIPLSEEQVRIEKEPVVREQVEVGKRQVTNTENREETVRREELRVDGDEDRLRKAS